MVSNNQVGGVRQWWWMMGEERRGAVLIGMPGAGKTVVGRELAALVGRVFVDTDEVIEKYFGASLQTLLEREGPEGFKRLEQFAILHHAFEPAAVVATGGSVIYSPAAVAALRQLGPLIYLQVDLETVRRRVGNWEARGFIRRPGQSLAEVYAERVPLYEAAADLILPCDHGAPNALAAHLMTAIPSSG